MSQVPVYRVLILSSAMFALAGCGSHHKSHESSSTSNSPAPATVSKPVPKSVAAYEEPDWSTPLAKYLPITDNNTVMFYYYANTGMPANYKTIASNFDEHYMDTNDVFTKHKIINEIKPRVESKIAYAKTHPYVYWPMFNFNPGKYSFKRHGFEIQNNMLINGGMISYDNYYTQFAMEIRNSGEFSFIPVKMELAKKIERWASSGKQLYVQPYLFVNGASLNHHRVKAVCTAISIYGPHKHLLIIYRPKH